MTYKMFPVFKGLQATTISNAFILNGIVAAMIAALSIEIRHQLNNNKGKIYLFFSNFLSGKTLSEVEIFSIVFLTSFVIAITAYQLMYLLFGFGPGMLSLKATRIKY